MAKGNYKSVYAPDTTTAPDWSGWVVQQENLNLQQQKWNKELLDDAEKKKKEKDDALKADLNELGYSKSPDFKLTGIEALDYNIRQITAEALEENYKLDQKITEGYANGDMTPFKYAELKYQKDQLMKLPENLAAAQARFKENVDEFNTGLQSGKYLKTPENQERLRRLQEGEYKIILDRNNKGQFLVVFDQDGDGEPDYIPMSDFMSDKGIGRKLPYVDVIESAKGMAKTIGTMHEKIKDPKNRLYTVETKGLKFNDGELKNFVITQAAVNPDDVDSFSYQRFGKMWNDLTDEQQDLILNDYISLIKGYVSEEYKSEFNTGEANYNLGVRRQAETERHNKAMENANRDEFNFNYKKWLNETGGGKTMEGYIDFKDVDGSNTDMKLPAYGIKNYNITDEKGTKIGINSVYAFPKSDGTIEIWGSTGEDNGNRQLSEAEITALGAWGITRDKIQNDFNALNNIGASTFSNGMTAGEFDDYLENLDL